ncbi:DUF4157 domain-containing protein [Streptomyces sp. NPDC058301]|uniref:eCIS core domain-containing protein n=1 Tax=Streptomyces sp. NPDC058301 TaxID=3346436 RepID=UPI0036EF1DA1
MPTTPQGAVGGPLGPAQLATLQGLVGNRVVARRVRQERRVHDDGWGHDQEQHVHGGGCGHDTVNGTSPSGKPGMEDTSPAGQRALLDAALASPSRPLSEPVLKNAEAFYQNDLSPTRVHDDPVAQRATAALGAEAMTVGHHIFLPPKVAGRMDILGHELSHVNHNLLGDRETGNSNGAGVTITDPGQGSEREATSDGADFAAGVGRASSVTAQRSVEPGHADGGEREAQTGAGGHGAERRRQGAAPGVVARSARRTSPPTVSRATKALTLQRMAGKGGASSSTKDVKDKDKDKGKAKASGAGKAREPSWKTVTNEITRLAKQCTCRQPNPRGGRPTPEVLIHYERSYKHQTDEQSLRHVGRQGAAIVAHLEKQQQLAAKAVTQESQVAQGKGEKKKAAASKDDEFQAMLCNGHLAFATNMNQTVHQLYDFLLDDSARDAGEDAEVTEPTGDSLRRSMVRDHSGAVVEGEGQEEREGTAAGSGKRAAAGSGRQGGKRRKTDKDAHTDAPPAPTYKDDQEQRDRQARLKLGEGLIARPRIEAMPPVSLGTEMDVDDPAPGEAGEYKRDNPTTQALRKVKFLRKVDISNEAAEDPAHRAYLAQLLSKEENEFTGYAYLLYNGSNKKDILHAEQKLLMMINHADVARDTPHDPVLIRGRKRPCKACLALLKYFRENVGIDLRYNENGNHFFKGPLGTVFQNFGGTVDVDWFREEMTDMEPSYVSAPRKVLPDEGDHIHPAVRLAHGGWEQRLMLEEVASQGRPAEVSSGEESEVDAKETMRRYPAHRGLQGMVDTPSDSEVEEDGHANSQAMADLVTGTRRINLDTHARQGPVVKLGEAKRKREQADFEKAIAQLRPLITEDLEEERLAHQKGKSYREEFPAALLSKIDELTDDASEKKLTSKARIAAYFDIKPAALGNKLKSLGGSEQPRKQSRSINAAEEKELERALAAEKEGELFRTWTNLGAGETWSPSYSPAFKNLLLDLIDNRGVSWTSVGAHLTIKPSTFSNRVTTMRKEAAKKAAGEGSGSG